MKKFIGITGTTSVGKSETAVLLAQKLHTEVISADSMQIYKGMDIGTAKITESERLGIKHHMIDIVEPNQSFSSFLYQEEVSKIFDEINGVPIIAGGTGFYFDSLLFPPEFGVCSSEKQKEFREILCSDGLETLQDMLLKADPETYRTIDVKNPKRVLRALEIAACGMKKSEGKNSKGEWDDPRYECRLFVLQRDRKSLYEQIDRRVDDMINDGLVEEVRTLVAKYGDNAYALRNAIGYKEIIEWLSGSILFDEAIEKIKINTRHYAKRQITYFKKMNVFEFIDVEGLDAVEISNHIEEKCKNFILL